MTSLPTQLSSTFDSVKNNSLLNYHVEGPFVRVGNTNRDKRVLLSGLVPTTGIKWSFFCPGWCYQPGQKEDFLFGLVPPTGTKDPCPPLARLTIGSGTKATYCPESKDNRDK